MQKFATYSLADTSTVFNHPNVGTMTLSDCGGGKITISHAADMSSHTTTANGYVIVNKLRAHNGTIALELPQNSDSDLFMRKWVRYLDVAAVKFFALATITVSDTASGLIYTCTGVTPQKSPDVVYDSASGMVAYALLAADITEFDPNDTTNE